MSETEATETLPVIVDLGKQKKKHVKRLRRGQGRLMDDVQDVMATLREEGAVGENAQPVFIIVREKPEDPWRFEF